MCDYRIKTGQLKERDGNKHRSEGGREGKSLRLLCKRSKQELATKEKEEGRRRGEGEEGGGEMIMEARPAAMLGLRIKMCPRCQAAWGFVQRPWDMEMHIHPIASKGTHTLLKTPIFISPCMSREPQGGVKLQST